MCLFPGRLADAPLCFWDGSPVCVCVCVCERDIKCEMGSSFSPPDRLNPCENTAAASPNTAAIGATTRARRMRYQVGAQLCKGTRDKEAYSSGGGESHRYSFLSNPLWLTLRCAKT